MRASIAFLALLISVRALVADGPADNLAGKVRPVPPLGAPLPDRTRAELMRGADKLARQLAEMRTELKQDKSALALLPDVEVLHKAVDWAVRYNEIFNPTNEVPAARALLKLASSRLEQIEDGRPLWTSATGLVVRGYVSRLDGSVQPYGLVVPATYRPGSPHRHRLDIWFHGRNEKLTELNFLAERQRSYGEFTPPDTIVLHTYSRFCNGQKLAGEVDVFEALQAVRASYPIDEDRIVVRGFSLGGAACWHIAAHYPGHWAAAAPGAGFSETPEFLNVFQKEQLYPAWYEQKLWRQYNATDYALNFFHLPVVAYSGEIDAQKQAADAMAAALRTEGIELTHVIGPRTKHSYHPAARQEINRRIDAIAAEGRDRMPRQVRFTTWTLRYNQCAWLTIDALDRHWDQARVHAEITDANRIRIQSENVTALTLSMPPGSAPFDVTERVRVLIDQSEIAAPKPGSDRSWEVSVYKSGTRWFAGRKPEDGLVKQHGLQGPIDDAFMDSFIVVAPTGRSTNDKVTAWVQAEFTRFTNEWRRHFRGHARVKDDIAVTASDIAAHNLIIWGDLDSNHLLARIMPQLPVEWSRTQVGIGRWRHHAGHHVPLLIYPNPLNPKRYVVLNSGFTFREYDYLNNARQVPKLPDWAVIDINTPPSSRWPGKVVDAGFFDERWK